MKIIAKYFSQRGEVKLVLWDKSYKVVFKTHIKPGVSYSKEFSCASYEQALVKFNDIANIYKKASQLKCGFIKKEAPTFFCAKANCPQVLGNAQFWDEFSYDCRYKVR